MSYIDLPILVAGNTGLVGSSVCRELARTGYKRIITINRKTVDLRDARSTMAFLDVVNPAAIIVCAAKVGGILANNSYPVNFIHDNVLIQTNIISGAHRNGVKKLILLGSSCIYPKFSKQPIKEECLLSGELEDTNRAYAVAKICGVEMCRSYNRQFDTDYIVAMPTNLYGPNDRFFDEQGSHVVPAMINKIHSAKQLDQAATLLGTGSPRREFLHVDDLARALVLLLDAYDVKNKALSDLMVNIGYGSDITIKELATKIASVIGFNNAILWDTSFPDGTPQKLLDSSRIRSLGWAPRITLEDGLASTYREFIKWEKSQS